MQLLRGHYSDLNCSCRSNGVKSKFLWHAKLSLIWARSMFPECSFPPSSCMHVWDTLSSRGDSQEGEWYFTWKMVLWASLWGIILIVFTEARRTPCAHCGWYHFLEGILDSINGEKQQRHNDPWSLLTIQSSWIGDLQFWPYLKIKVEGNCRRQPKINLWPPHVDIHICENTHKMFANSSKVSQDADALTFRKFSFSLLWEEPCSSVSCEDSHIVHGVWASWLALWCLESLDRGQAVLSCPHLWLGDLQAHCFPSLGCHGLISTPVRTVCGKSVQKAFREEKPSLNIS